jgi:hypothetical protein
MRLRHENHAQFVVPLDELDAQIPQPHNQLLILLAVHPRHA